MHIAKTVRDIATLQNPIARTIMNRSALIDRAFVDRVLSLPHFTWHGRRPQTAFNTKGDPRDHDLDLLSVMVELMRRQAHIKLPGYGNMLPWEISEGEQHVGTDRFGKIKRLISHREHLSFSVEIVDESIIRHTINKTGALRSYAMVGYDGTWNKGWRGVVWCHNKEEAEFFRRRRLLQADGLHFKYYVHPHRRQSYAGAPYLLLKLLWQRLEDEASYYATELKRLEINGVYQPNDLEKPAKRILARGQSRNVFVRRFMMKLEGLDYYGNYPNVSVDEAGYRAAYLQQQLIIKTLQPLVQFVVRADEAAFYLYGMESGYTPWWIKGSSWVTDNKHIWTRLALGDVLSLSYYTDEVPKQVAV